MATSSVKHLPLAPLGAGDLIDRAVRLYRRNFMTLIRIASPPVIVSAVGSVMWTMGWRQVIQAGSDVSLALFGVMIFVGTLLMACGLIFNFIVMGGAARNLVTHLLWNEPVSARATYRNVRERFWGLLGAAMIVGFSTLMIGLITLIVWYIAFAIIVFGAIISAQTFPAWLSATVGIIGFCVATTGALTLFFFLFGRFAYVLQVLLVEGKDVFAAVGRSFSLARGNVRRLMAMSVFYWLATYSAWMILLVPLGLYGWMNGVDLSPIAASSWPEWYTLIYSVLWQSSLILLSPVWMLGLSLLYVDERVRHEGYDIELLAARQLEPMPETGAWQTGNYTPALVTQPNPGQQPSTYYSSGSTLGLR